MLRAYETAVVRLRTHTCAEDETEDTTYFVVELLCCVLTLTEPLEIWVSHMIVSVTVACCTCETVCPGTHLDVETVENSLLIVAASAPVTYYNTVKAPLTLEDVHEELLVVAVELTIVEVI